MIIIVYMRVAESGPSAMRLIEDSSFDDEEHSLAVSESFQKGGKSFKIFKNWGPYGVEYNNFKRFKGYNTIIVKKKIEESNCYVSFLFFRMSLI